MRYVEPVAYVQQVAARAAVPLDLAAPATLALALGLGSFIRLWDLGALGFNSDEAVYMGQAAAIANDSTLEQFFPVFRAHPLLYQALLSLGFLAGFTELFGRFITAMIGVATVFLVYHLATLLYGRKAGLCAALLMAVMPYHVVVTRQVLLDGPMVFMATLTLYCVARYASTERPGWLYAAGAAMGLTFLLKETSILLIGALYAFFALSPGVRFRIREAFMSLVITAATISPFPLTLILNGRQETGGQYLAWQLFRRPNHTWDFYPTTVPEAMGYGVVLAAALGLWFMRKRWTWRETLLVSWILVPVFFFQLYPVKGFQYLLPAAPPMAVLAGRAVAGWTSFGRFSLPRLHPTPNALTVGAMGLLVLSLFVGSWTRIQPSNSEQFLAGSGGVPGGREAGQWIERNVPEGARLMTIGPSMANILQYYGHRKANGLSVSPNPLHRNPSYEPVLNPDLLIRSNEIQYIVWDSFSASRSSFFSQQLLRYVDRYNGRVVHVETVTVRTDAGEYTQKPVIVIYEVRP